MLDRKALGQKIRTLRHRRGWSQRALADALGYSQQSVSAIELGTISIDLESLGRLSVTLGTSTHDLLSCEPTDQLAISTSTIEFCRRQLDESTRILLELPDDDLREEVVRIVFALAQHAQGRVLERQAGLGVRHADGTG